MILIHQHSVLNTELHLRVVSSTVQNLLSVPGVYRSVISGTALAWRSLHRVAMALKASVGAVGGWHFHASFFVRLTLALVV
ncbi:hypothetical protein V2J93_17065 [Pseudomonas alliivorans]|nr:hypothetical protein [Pseudomonas alliivorans]